MSENSFKKRDYDFIAPKDSLFSRCNKVWISGIIDSDLKFNHESFKKKFYRTTVKVGRLSPIKDYIPIIVSESLIQGFSSESSLKGRYVDVEGEFHSFKSIGKDDKIHLDLFLFVKSIKIYGKDEYPNKTEDTNLVFLNAHIHKKPVCRKTQLSKRLITELFVIVRRNDHASDFIPCLAWGDLAVYASNLKVGDKVKLCGRMQSREYFKRYSQNSNEGEYRMTYEVSLFDMMKIED